MSPFTLFLYVVALGAGLLVWVVMAVVALAMRALLLTGLDEEKKKQKPAGPPKRWQWDALLGIVGTVAFSAGFVVIASMPGANVELAMPFICLPLIALAAALSCGWIKVRR